MNGDGVAILESGKASVLGFLADPIGSRELNVAKASVQGISAWVALCPLPIQASGGSGVPKESGCKEHGHNQKTGSWKLCTFGKWRIHAGTRFQEWLCHRTADNQSLVHTGAVGFWHVLLEETVILVVSCRCLSKL